MALPNNAIAHTISWNNHDGWLVCGGENALLRVLKLEYAIPEIKSQKSALMNQPLTGHSGIFYHFIH